MHSKATPNSPFTAFFCFPLAKGNTAVKASVAALFNRAISLAAKSLLLLILIFGFSVSDSWAQTYTTRVYADQQNGSTAGLLCVSCGVTNGPNAVDNTPGFQYTASTLNITAGLLGSVYQELVFSNGPNAPVPSPSTPITLKVGSTASALSLGVLGEITLQAYNGTTAIGSPITVNSGLLSLNLLASGNQAYLTFPAPGVAFDRVRLTLNGGLLSAAKSINIYSAFYTKTTTGPVACDKAIDLLTGVVGSVGALGGVTNGPLAIDGDPSTFSVLNATVTALGNYAQETAIFPGLSAPGDSVRILISQSGSLLNLALLQNFTILTYNGATVVDSVTGSSALLVLNLLSGSTSIQTLSFKASGSFDRIQVRLGGTLSALSSINVHEIQRVGPGPNSSGSGTVKSTCVNTPLTLYVSNPDLTNLTYTWYDSTQTTVLSLADSLVLSGAQVATPGTYKYYVSATRKTCTTESAKTLVTVLVNPTSVESDISVPSPVQYCPGDTVRITPTSPTETKNPVFTWYKDNSTNAPITNGQTDGTATYFISGNGTLSIVGLSMGTYNYFVAVSDSNHCQNDPGKRAHVMVTMGTAPAPPTVVPTVNASTGVPVTLTAAAVSGATIVWYQDTTAAPIATGATTVVGPFNAPGTYTYYAAVQLPGGCRSYRVPVVVTINGPVTPPTGCNVPTSQVNGTTLGCVLCSVSNPGNDIDNDPTNFTSLNATVNLLGGAVYQQLIFPTPGVATDSIRLDLAYPAGLANLGVLSGIVITSANNTTVVRKDTISSLLSLRILDIGSGRFTVTVPTGAAFDRVQILYKGTLSALTTVNIYGARIVAPNPTAISNNVTVCAGSVATLQATPAAGTNIQWFADSTGGAALSNQNTYTTDTLRTPGVVTYYIQVFDANNANCANPDRIPVKVTVRPLGSPSNITVPSTTNTCTNGTAVITPTATGVLNPVFKWYSDPNKNNPITNGTVGGVTYAINSSGQLSITGLTMGTYTYYVSVSGDTTCENAAGNLAPAVVNVTSVPAPPTVNQSVSVSTGTPVTLVASPASGGTVLWYSDTTQAPIGRGSSITLPAFNTPGTYSYYAGDSISGGCISNRILVTITVTGPIVNPNCNVPTSQVNGTTLGCVLCSVQNPNNDIDLDTTNFTTLSIPVGLLGGSVYQQLIFPTPGTG
ncbi:hypothetical protein DVR12_11155, partial [Chitinophaga silvatica]